MTDKTSCWVCGRDADPGSGHLELLKRLRLRISEDVFDPETPSRDLAALSRQLRDIVKEIDTLEERARLEGKQNGNVSTRPSDTGDWTPDSV